MKKLGMKILSAIIIVWAVVSTYSIASTPFDLRHWFLSAILGAGGLGVLFILSQVAVQTANKKLAADIDDPEVRDLLFGQNRHELQQIGIVVVALLSLSMIVLVIGKAYTSSDAEWHQIVSLNLGTEILGACITFILITVFSEGMWRAVERLTSTGKEVLSTLERTGKIAQERAATEKQVQELQQQIHETEAKAREEREAFIQREQGYKEEIAILTRDVSHLNTQLQQVLTINKSLLMREQPENGGAHRNGFRGEGQQSITIV